MAKVKTTLSTGWQWRMADANGNQTADNQAALKEWSPASSFPSVIHMELLSRKLIPNPNIGENERLIQWVGEPDWEYACSFMTPDGTGEMNHVDLVFEGLDTYATVWLNETQILKSDNMFIPERVSIKENLKASGVENELRILFESPLKATSRLEDAYGPRTSMMRDKRRMHARKAQYHWGWDWGPIVLTSGPYLPIHIEAYNSRIEDVHVVPKLMEDHESADISVTVTAVESDQSPSMNIEIIDSNGHAVATLSGKTSNPVTITLKSPKLWWPNGQGDQHLYSTKVSLLDAESKVLDQSTTRFGIRTIEVIQRPLKEAPGTTFMFRVNGRDIFAQGGDWIPADMLLPTISRERYFEWIRLARHCHLNMIRVWGGGIYETEDFFDACDEMGMLVWHDYAFACGDYPIHGAFIDTITKEAEAQTTRLRNRASLALLCGGNEDFMLADWNHLEYDHSDLIGPFDETEFPQRKIYLDVLPKIARRLCPNIQYWASSPFGGSTANDTTIGDIHQWSVWHLEQLPYQEYKKIGGRFVSEFGMHGYPVNRTVEYFCQGAPKSQLHPQSRLIDCHNKGHGAHTRIARYLAENFRFDITSLKNFIYSSQLLQSEAYGYALRQWKRQFNGPGFEECAGAIIWQLNDVYPVTSWAFVDYFLRPKPAYYTIRRECGPISVSAERTPSTLWVDEDKPRQPAPPFFDIWAHNTSPKVVECLLLLRAYDFAGGSWTELAGNDQERQVSLKPGQNNELGQLAAQQVWTSDSLIILELSLVDIKTRAALARHVDWPEPFRYLYWPVDTSIDVTVQKGESGVTHVTGLWEDTVVVSANQPLKGVWLEPIYDGKEVDTDREPLWEDNMLDILPNREVRVRVSGLKGRKVSARFYADWEVSPIASR